MSRYEATQKISGVYLTNYHREIPQRDSDLRIIATEGDRLDLLANRFYNNPTLWWFLARANNLKTMNVPAGTKLRVPAQPSL